MKVLHSVCQQIWKTQQWQLDWKTSVFIPMPKNVESTTQLDSSQLSSVTQLCPTLCDPRDCITPGLPVHHQLTEPIQTHVDHIGNTIQPSHPLSSHSPPTFNLPSIRIFSNGSSQQVAKVLELQLQQQSFQ